MDVSIIIVNYNTRELTSKCIDSIYERTSGVSYEVILVDNASSDGSVELFRKDDRIIFVGSDKNLGFGKANNLGFLHSKGNYIFLLNSDTILLNNAIKLFFEKMETIGPEVGCMGCILKDSNQKYAHSYANFPNVGNVLVTHVWKQLFSFLGFEEWKMDAVENRKNNPSFFQVEYVTGADLFIRRSIVEQFGLFDPEFFMYYEDTELQCRYFRHGFLSYIYDAPQIVHLEGRSVSSSNKRYLMIFDGMLTYLSKTESCWKDFLLRFLLLMKTPYTMVLQKFNKKEIKAYLHILLGGHLNMFKI